jgi:hypothetical protein
MRYRATIRAPGATAQAAGLTGTTALDERYDIPGPIEDRSSYIESFNTADDLTPPTLVLPAGVPVDATSPDGAVAAFDVSAVDDIDPAPAVACVPQSGSTFPVGDTSVSCAATDAAGNVGTGSFLVHVRGAAEQLDALNGAVGDAGLGRGLTNDLGGRLDRASRLLDTPARACHELDGFAARIFDELGHDSSSLSSDEALQLLGATTVEQALGCIDSGSQVPLAERDTVDLVAVIGALDIARGEVSDLRATAGRIGGELANGRLAQAANDVEGLARKVAADVRRNQLAPDQAAQLSAAIAQVTADLGG